MVALSTLRIAEEKEYKRYEFPIPSTLSPLDQRVKHHLLGEWYLQGRRSVLCWTYREHSAASPCWWLLFALQSILFPSECLWHWFPCSCCNGSSEPHSWVPWEVKLCHVQAVFRCLRHSPAIHFWSQGWWTVLLGNKRSLKNGGRAPSKPHLLWPGSSCFTDLLVH